MKQKFFFVAVFLIALFFRFYMLSAVPPSASLDEATIGWNAYSILHTGKDEYGYFLPILLRAYDDYRPALYVYLVVPFVKLFGLSVFSVRLPSVLMSLATVVMSYFLTKNIFSKLKRKESIALIVMLLLAISPWHIYVSRLGHEVNLGLTLIVASVLLFTEGVKRKNGWFFTASFVGFALSFYSYQSEKVFTPVMIIFLSVIFWQQLIQYKRQVLLGIILFVVITIPIFFSSLSPGALLRLKGTSIFTNNSAYDISAKNVLNAKLHHDLLGEILNNRRIVTGEIFLKNYFSHFSPFWFFGNSGNEQFKAPNTGLLYLWEAPFLLVGILFFFFSKDISSRIKFFIFG